MTPLRVLHVVPHLDRVGGYERQAVTLARQQLRGRSAEPIVLTHGVPSLPVFSRGLEGEIHRLRKGIMRYHPGQWWRLHGHRVQVVHAHALHKLSGQVLALAHASKLPTVVKVATEDDVAMFSDPAGWVQLLDGDEDGPRGVRWRLMIKAAWKRLRRAGAFVALTDGIADQLAQHGLTAVRLPNGVDAETFRPPTALERSRARDALALPTDARCVVYVGRLSARKCVSDLIAAFARLVERGDSRVHLVIAGEGHEHATLEERVRRAGCDRQVSFLGLLEDVRDALFAADVVVNPSAREGMPNAVLEAWGTGLATVLSDIPAHRNMIAEGGSPPALVYPHGDPMALAARMAGLLDSPERRAALGHTARTVALEHHAIDRIDRAYQELYRVLGNERAERGAD